MLVCLISIALILLLKESSGLNVYVDPVHGFNNATCDSARAPCRSLQHVLADNYRKNGTRYCLFGSGVHYLHLPISKFKNLDSVSFIAFGRMSTVQCSENAGFVFEGVTNIHFSNVNFVNCSAGMNGTSKADGNNIVKRASLYFSACQNVSMKVVNVSCSPNTTGVAMYDTIGVNSFSGSVFSSNDATNGGSGFHLSISTDLDRGISASVHKNNSSVFLFDNCVFSNNDNTKSSRSSPAVLGNEVGLSIYTNNLHATKTTNLHRDNSPDRGGELLVEFRGERSDNRVIVSGSRIQGKVCLIETHSDTMGESNTCASLTYTHEIRKAFSRKHFRALLYHYSNTSMQTSTCSPGLVWNEKSMKCSCVNNKYEGMITCKDNETALLKPNSWIGCINGSVVACTCPKSFCSKNQTDPRLLPKNWTDLDKVICGKYNRTGILCGECSNGSIMVINSFSYDCVADHSCDKINFLAYIAAVYVPLTVFFTIIVFFDIHLTSAPANAFILYSQVITSTFDLSADGEIPISKIAIGNETATSFLKGYKTPYGIFDLQFFAKFISPACLWSNMNTFDIKMLDYMVAIFPLLMIAIVFICFKINEVCQSIYKKKRSQTNSRQQRRQKRNISKHWWNRKKAVLPAFAAFLLLSYNKFVTTTSYFMNMQEPVDEWGNKFGQSRLYYAGQYKTNDPLYLEKYLAPVCCFLTVFVIIPPLLLLDWPMRIFELLISKVGCMWRHYPSDKIHIFLDIFQGCYKNNMRCFAGVYFLFRFVISIVNITAQTWISQFIVQQIACAVMITLLAICRPYNDQNKIFNMVDILIFTNLGLINCLTLYLYFQTQSIPQQFHSHQNTLPAFVFYIQYTLIFLPMLYMIIYIVWYLTNPFRKRFSKKLRSLIRKKRCSQIQSDGPSEVERLLEMQSSSTKLAEESVLLRRAEEKNQYRHPRMSPGTSPKNSSSISGLENSSDTHISTHKITVPRYDSNQ